jgi:hypothetical protein
MSHGLKKRARFGAQIPGPKPGGQRVKPHLWLHRLAPRFRARNLGPKMGPRAPRQIRPAAGRARRWPGHPGCRGPGWPSMARRELPPGRPRANASRGGVSGSAWETAAATTPETAAASQPRPGSPRSWDRGIAGARRIPARAGVVFGWCGRGFGQHLRPGGRTGIVGRLGRSLPGCPRVPVGFAPFGGGCCGPLYSGASSVVGGR